MSRDPIDDLAARLFLAARQETPSEESQQRIAAALRTRRSAPILEPLTGWLRISKPFVFLAAAAALAGLALSLAGEQKSNQIQISPDPLVLRQEQSKTTKTEDLRPSTATELELPAKAEDDSAQLGPAPKATAGPKPTSLPPVKRRPASLEQELASVRKARSALGGGNAQAALTEIDSFGRESGWRQLNAESSLIRIEALAQLGRSNEAATAAQRFVKQHPNNPLVDRAQNYTILPTANTEKQPKK